MATPALVKASPPDDEEEVDPSDFDKLFFRRVKLTEDERKDIERDLRTLYRDAIDTRGDLDQMLAHWNDMAEGIAQFRRARPATLVVGILGAGHVRHGYGVPHQLQALNADQIAKLITLPSDHSCSELTPGLADAVYVIPPQAEAESAPPHLGISLKDTPLGVMIEMVMPGSLAQRSGLMNGDVIVQAAGTRVSHIEEVRAQVQRQPAGTWLPLQILRGGASLEIVVRFPANPEPLRHAPGKH